MQDTVRVRIAPSPTGYIHVGNTYTAYYNYVFAKRWNGQLVLRLDDTDLERYVEDAEEQIYRLFRWLGIEWDEGPDIGGPHKEYRQSERIEAYRSRADKLVEVGLAYHHEGAIFLRVEDTGSVEFMDLVRGIIHVNKSEIKDQVLIKKNGYPTYMFATVVDDIDFAISHVIRAEDHLSNTPKQILMFEALGADLPRFAHLPLLRNPDRSKLSKRQAHTSLAWYREEGFLPEALKNYLALLGWSHPEEEEIFDEAEFMAKFLLEQVNTTAPVFDLEKLRWMNGMYIRRIQNIELRSQLEEFMQEFQPREWEKIQAHASYETYMTDILRLSQERLKVLGEFWEQNKYFWQTPETDDQKIEKFWPESERMGEFIERVVDVLSVNDLLWKAETLEKKLREVQDELNLKPKSAFMTLRLVVTGQATTPPLFDTLEVLGKVEVVERLRAFVKS